MEQSQDRHIAELQAEKAELDELRKQYFAVMSQYNEWQTKLSDPLWIDTLSGAEFDFGVMQRSMFWDVAQHLQTRIVGPMYCVLPCPELPQQHSAEKILRAWVANHGLHPSKEQYSDLELRTGLKRRTLRTFFSNRRQRQKHT